MHPYFATVGNGILRTQSDSLRAFIFFFFLPKNPARVASFLACLTGSDRGREVHTKKNKNIVTVLFCF